MPEPVSWREPTSLLPLRWGHPRSRVLGGLVLIVSGGVAIAGGSPFANWLLAGGTVLHVTGWAVLPADGWRRVVAMCASTFAMWFLLTGPRWLGVLALPYLGWLLVRHRPPASFITVVFVIAGAGMVASRAPEYRDMLLALGVEGAVLVASAWVARMLHRGQWAAAERRRAARSGDPGGTTGSASGESPVGGG